MSLIPIIHIDRNHSENLSFQTSGTLILYASVPLLYLLGYTYFVFMENPDGWDEKTFQVIYNKAKASRGFIVWKDSRQISIIVMIGTFLSYTCAHFPA